MNFQIQTKSKQFLKPDELLSSVGVSPEAVIADFGCGNGYYSVAAGILVGAKAQVFALDLMEDALSQTASLAKLTGLHNIITKLCNLETIRGSSLADTSCDLIILASILHQVENKENLLREAYRILKTGGKVLVVEWEKVASFGPEHKIRVMKEEVKKLAEKLGFRPEKELPAGSFHYALLFKK